jgi:hypothetical protein
MKSKKKINIMDFPPSFENKKVRIWGEDSLDGQREDLMEYRGTMKIDNPLEQLHEVRAYSVPSGELFLKMISKIHTKTRVITAVIKTGGIVTEPLTYSTEKEYFEYVRNMERELSEKLGFDMGSSVNIVDQGYLEQLQGKNKEE